MAVDAIGNVPTPQDNAAITRKSSISQDDFIKLFLAQLQFQDPLEPVDNREFLAQLAQFSALEQSRQTSENLASMLSMNAADQAVGLVGKVVDAQVEGNAISGTVIAVEFTSAGPKLSLRAGSGGAVQTGVALSQVSLVKSNQ
ncbi:flagellar basal-body rod modification protein FlgD [Lysobacter enzymogenes]|uniref:Basal-body rod modification protein FlgD n=1 Tax=Lysobacter enzymogenes TaxID=69 RepID=A0AAU9ALB1_LYSEN|nr:flagellar hook capping FlgD N-terminal domain-containing protein [Lysobacter enzymogenes]MBN7138465.1 hypothetical protein [Lysobacter enzymogenes]BAV96923.1 flagellar basal-body rod modification protein FlgD [Lysobacter enzymogenes]